MSKFVEMPSAKMSYEFQNVTIVPLSDQERISQTISEEHVGTAVSAMHRDGVVVLSNSVDIAHVDQLNDILCREAVEMANLPTTHFNNVSSTCTTSEPQSAQATSSQRVTA
jgi:hypothetical protein